MYEIVKDIIIPLVAPSIAVFGLILFGRNERKRIQIAYDHKIAAKAEAIKRDLEILLQTYITHVAYISNNGTADQKRISVISETADRVLKEIQADSLVYVKYLKSKNTPLLLSELEVRLKDDSQESKNDTFLHFAFAKLLYLIEDDKGKKTEWDSICQAHLKANLKLFSPFME